MFGWAEWLLAEVRHQMRSILGEEKVERAGCSSTIWLAVRAALPD
jgi:hypothetical protein